MWNTLLERRCPACVRSGSDDIGSSQWPHWALSILQIETVSWVCSAQMSFMPPQPELGRWLYIWSYPTRNPCNENTSNYLVRFWYDSRILRLTGFTEALWLVIRRYAEIPSNSFGTFESEPDCSRFPYRSRDSVAYVSTIQPCSPCKSWGNNNSGYCIWMWPPLSVVFSMIIIFLPILHSRGCILHCNMLWGSGEMLWSWESWIRQFVIIEHSSVHQIHPSWLGDFITLIQPLFMKRSSAPTSTPTHTWAFTIPDHVPQ